MKRDNYLRDIADHLGRISHQVEVRNRISLFDLNQTLEDFYAGLLNLVYSLNLVNINIEERNAIAIDLGDKAARKSFQVTSDISINKIRETVSKFEKAERDADYDVLTILLLKKKKRYRSLPVPAKVKLLVHDHLDLIEDIKSNCSDIQHLESLWRFLEDELVKNSQDKSEADTKILDTFSDNASRYIAQVAEHIVAGKKGEPPLPGLDNTELLEKFKRMKCSPTYKSKFDRHAVFFSSVNEIMTTDAVEGGAATIRVIFGLIQSIYMEVLEQSINGDRIHNEIMNSLLTGNNYSPEEVTAAETLVFYTINECGIFNETK